MEKNERNVDQEKVADAVDGFMGLSEAERITALHTLVIDPDVNLMYLLRQLIVEGCPGCLEDEV